MAKDTPKKAPPSIQHAHRLTDAVRETVVRMVGMGMHLGPAGEAAGASKRSVRRWLEQGAGIHTAAMDGTAPSTPNEIKLRRFYWEVTRAIGACEGRYVGTVAKSAQQGNARAAMDMLERRFPERWAKRQLVQVEIQKSVEGVLEAVRPHMSGPGYAELLTALGKVMPTKGLPAPPEQVELLTGAVLASD